MSELHSNATAESTTQGDGLPRLTGTVRTVRPTYFFIAGDDGIERFSMPGELLPPHRSVQVQSGQRVEFTPAPGRPDKSGRTARVRLL